MIKIFYNNSTKKIRLYRVNKKAKKYYYVISIEDTNLINVIIGKYIKEYLGREIDTIEEYREIKPYEILFSFPEIKEKLIFVNNFLKKYSKCKTQSDLYSEGHYYQKDGINIWFSRTIKKFNLTPLKITFKEMEKQYPDIFK